MLCVAVSASVFGFDGHVTHGVNTFNNKAIVDFSGSSNIFAALGPAHEIGVLQPGAGNASIITEDVPPETLMANIDAFDLQMGLGLPSGVGPFNIPIAKVPTIFAGSMTINNRVTPNEFSDSSDVTLLGSPYLSKRADNNVTLGKWNRASGRISGSCNKNGARVRVQIKNGLPNGVYTMWDVGVRNSVTDQEAISAGPFGGLPNIITTNRAGSGSLRRELNYCPTDKCRGSARCTLYVSLFYHFDHMVYAGSPAIDSAGQAIGMVASNQIQFFINADVIVPQQNRF